MSMTRLIRGVALTLASGLALVSATAGAQQYPNRPVRVIVVFPPGGSNDVTARIVFQKMPDIMGQQFVVDNRGGASGTIGSEVVARSPADGYTLMVQSATHVANPHLFKKLPYDVLNDFIGVTTLARQVAMLVTHPAMPVKTIKEFIALGKARPGDITYGSAGSGSYTHLTVALFAQMTNLKLIHVPYKGGGPSSAALVGGETQAMIATIASLYPHLRANRLRALGVTSAERVKQFPDVPAIAEAVPGYEFTAWVACFVPAGTPRPIVNALNNAFKTALADKGVAEKLSNQTLDPMHMSPEQFAERLKADFEKYGRLMKLAQAKIG